MVLDRYDDRAFRFCTNYSLAPRSGALMPDLACEQSYARQHTRTTGSCFDHAVSFLWQIVRLRDWAIPGQKMPVCWETLFLLQNVSRTEPMYYNVVPRNVCAVLAGAKNHVFDEL